MSNPASSDECQLLREYARDRSQAAFREIVRRHIDLVYRCALRRVGGDAHLAEDVTQQVFVAMARQADSLSAGVVPAAWLFTCTRNVAAQLVRTERRRRVRENQAELMKAILTETNAEPDWEKLRPVLEEAIDLLGERDREAVVLRFFEDRTFADVGAQLQLSENAARMRVDRALDKLHGLLARRGIQSTAAALAVGLSGHLVGAAPAGLAATVAAAACSASGASVGGAAIVSFMSTIKVQLAALGVAGAVGGAVFVAEAQDQRALREELARLQVSAASLSPLQADEQRLQALAAEVADLRRDDAVLAALRDEIAVLQTARTNRERAASTATSASHVPVDPSGTVFDIGQLDQQPTPRRQVPPVYPPALRSAGTTGEVVVDFVVDTDGKVQGAYAKRSSNAALETAAVEAVRQWQFEAGLKSGQRVKAHLQVPIVFTISKDKLATEPWF